MISRKKPKADLRKSYTIYMEVGLIVALLFMIATVKVKIEQAPPTVMEIETQEVFQMEEVMQTRQTETPPPPVRPPVPIEVPNDEIIEDEIINLDAELRLDAPMDLPPPPPVEEEPEDNFFVVVEEMPEPVGGQAAIQRSVVYPEMARRAGIEGRVTVQFIVNKQGRVENARVVRGIGGGCDEAALKAVEAARFQPGKQRGRPVRVQMSISINFRLQS